LQTLLIYKLAPQQPLHCLKLYPVALQI